MVSLTVKTALGSFDFLDACDGEEEEDEKGDERSRNGRSVPNTCCAAKSPLVNAQLYSCRNAVLVLYHLASGGAVLSQQ